MMGSGYMCGKQESNEKAMCDSEIIIMFYTEGTFATIATIYSH